MSRPPPGEAATTAPCTPPDEPPGVRYTRPHRCNDRVEDLVQTLTSGRLASLPPAARALTACLRSEPGAEPAPADLPYTTLADGAPYLVPRRLDLRGKR